jgi:DNA-binding CsgD family transcriptional regulator
MTDAQRKLSTMYFEGRDKSTWHIAKSLHISTKTVETHRMHIKTKPGMASSAELTAYAAR